MDIMESFKNGVEFVGDTVSEIAAVIAEKNRLRCQLNHIKTLIKTDSATRDQAYIELGRFFYENLREGAAPENEAICAVIDAANDRISQASVRYMELLNQQNETKIRSENAEKLKKIVAEKASASAKVAKEKGAELGQKAKTVAADAVGKAKVAAADAAVKAKEAAADLKEKAAEKVDIVKDRLNPDRDKAIDVLIAEEQEKVMAAQEPEAQPADAPVSEDAAAVSEESPDEFDF